MNDFYLAQFNVARVQVFRSLIWLVDLDIGWLVDLDIEFRILNFVFRFSYFEFRISNGPSGLLYFRYTIDSYIEIYLKM